MKVYFSFEELSLIVAISGSRKNVLDRLTEIKDNSEQDIIPLVESSITKLKSITDEDFAALDFFRNGGKLCQVKHRCMPKSRPKLRGG